MLVLNIHTIISKMDGVASIQFFDLVKPHIFAKKPSCFAKKRERMIGEY